MFGKHFDYYPLSIQAGVIICDKPDGKKEGEADLYYLYNSCVNTLTFKNDEYVGFVKTKVGHYE